MLRPLRSSLLVLLGCLTLALSGHAAAQRPPVDGMRPADLRAHAIVGATVVIQPGQQLENATIVIRDGVIEAVGMDLDVPRDARLWPGEGLTVYPGLIDPALLIDPGDKPSGPGAHWNDRIHPQINMIDRSNPSSGLRKQMRELGFTAAAVYPESGILRGTGNVIALADENEHVLAYKDRAAMMAGFDYGRRWGSGGYPGSLMGAIALLRQTLHDAHWHADSRVVYHEHPEGNEPPGRADALHALADVIDRWQKVLFDADTEHNALRAARIADEFDLDMMLLGNGLEFRRLDAIVALDMPIILPLNYPDRPEVNTLATADRTSLREMMTWEQAPTNARRLVDAGATIALTTHRLDRRSQFHTALRNAIRHGLDEDAALAALTTIPAQLLGLERVLGTIAPGKAANLVVVDGELFDSDMKVRDTWINGRRHEITKVPDIVYVGSGTLTTDRGHEFPIEFDTKRNRISVTIPPEDEDDDETTVRATNVTVTRDQISFVIDAKVFDASGYARLSGVFVNDAITGNGVMPDGSTFTFAIDVDELRDPDEEPEEETKDDREEADDADDADVDDDPVTGEWRLTVIVPGMDQSIPVTLRLDRHADGSITGTSSAMGMVSDVRNAAFNESTGELQYTLDAPGGEVSLTARIVGDTMRGEFVGETVQGEFSGSRHATEVRTADADDDDDFEMPPDELVTPLGAFGLEKPLEAKSVLVRGATIWTAGPEGIIEDGWMHVRDGKIAGIGSGQPPLSAQSGPSSLRSSDPASDGAMLDLDASGKHITPGLIDCHSHTGITDGVNEWTHVNTAEVRIRDVIDPESVHWYRQLAGGLTAANQLHGSANPIGGQNSVVKLKWGGLAEDMLVDDAIEGIKFALGENVVRSQSRYPNTRMGVETVLRDSFTAAREYAAEWDRYNALGEDEQARTMPPRRDLTLDALAEILAGERLVHCHSYRQDEILMLIRVAEDFGFTIGTFQHVLEGYKVAEAIAAHGAGASAFSDWWGFKMEVMDAIPHGGAVMHEQGVNVSFNSDSSELARRMNNEASKAVRYGGVEPHDALKFVTINPAWQLRIDHRTGSLEVGKDADFVIWSGDPLSTYSRAEQTWIEGVKYFDIERDQELRGQVRAERERLIQKILAEAHGAPSEPEEDVRETESEDASEVAQPSRLMARLIENRRRAMEEEYRLGRDPEEIRPGECGCNEFWFDLTRFGLR